MAYITLKTNFDICETLTFVSILPNGDTFGILNLCDGKIKFIKHDGNVMNFKDEAALQNFVDDNKLSFSRPMSKGERWIPYNPNPHGRNTGDCTIRAYTKAFGLSWDEAFDIASKYGKEYGALPNDPKVVDKILTEEFKCSCVRVKKSTGRMTVSEFASTHPKGTYLIKIYGHLVTVVNGFYYDTWDSGSKKVMSYYEAI